MVGAATTYQVAGLGGEVARVVDAQGVVLECLLRHHLRSVTVQPVAIKRNIKGALSVVDIAQLSSRGVAIAVVLSADLLVKRVGSVPATHHEQVSVAVACTSVSIRSTLCCSRCCSYSGAFSSGRGSGDGGGVGNKHQRPNWSATVETQNFLSLLISHTNKAT